jgi:hypothetical protein
MVVLRRSRLQQQRRAKWANACERLMDPLLTTMLMGKQIAARIVESLSQ